MDVLVDDGVMTTLASAAAELFKQFHNALLQCAQYCCTQPLPARCAKPLSSPEVYCSGGT